MLVKSRTNNEPTFICRKGLEGYEFEDKISGGTFGEVDLYRNRNGGHVAIKKFVYKNTGLVHLTTIRELKSLMQLKGHKNVIEINEIAVKDGIIHAIFPFYEKTLRGMKYSLMKDLREHFRQIVEGMKHIHSRNIMHRDLKPANILLDNKNTIKIIDFGMSRKTAPQMTSVVTTLWYRAPELLELGPKPCYACYSYAVDVWSLGIILLEMLTGEAPVQGNSEVEQLKLIKKKLFDLRKTFYYLNENAKVLLSSMLDLDPSKRPPLDEILESAFLQETDENEKVDYITNH